jgi:hypothetical protein
MPIQSREKPAMHAGSLREVGGFARRNPKIQARNGEGATRGNEKAAPFGAALGESDKSVSITWRS